MGLAVITKTLQDVIDRVERQFGDESGSQVTTADITRWVNAAQLEIIRKNRILKASSTTASVSGQSQYTFTSLNILNIEGLHYAGKPLTFLSFIEAQDYINRYDPDGIQTDTPTMWYEFGTALYVYPVPSQDGDDITLFYVQYPTDVSSTTDSLAVPDQYFEAVCQYVLSQAYEQDDDWQGSAAKSQQFDRSASELSQDGQRYNRGRYRTITVLEEDM